MVCAGRSLVCQVEMSMGVNGDHRFSQVGLGCCQNMLMILGFPSMCPTQTTTQVLILVFGGVNQDNQWLSWEVYFAGGRLILDFKDKLGCQRKKFQKSEDKSYRLKTGMGLHGQ